MSLSVGIVGLPNAGKSTLFNALVARRLSPTAAHPFTTIEPHEAVVPVPDENLEKLEKLVSYEVTKLKSKINSSNSVTQSLGSLLSIVPATVTFIDIAGLVKGAHEGAGLGNQFLAKIREVDALVHVVRLFDPSASFGQTPFDKAQGGQDRRSGQVIPHVMGDINPTRDIEVVNLELELAGIKKPMIYVYNVGEEEILQKVNDRQQNVTYPGLVISAKLEEELSDLQPEERKQYLKELGLEESGLEKLIKAAYKLLNLITFYTIKGGKEIHAWSIKNGSNALDAAEKVHTDFAKHFIKAEVIKVDTLLEVGSPASPEGTQGGWNKARESGKVRIEGKDYIVGERDVIEFKVGV